MYSTHGVLRTNQEIAMKRSLFLGLCLSLVATAASAQYYVQQQQFVPQYAGATAMYYPAFQQPQYYPQQRYYPVQQPAYYPQQFVPQYAGPTQMYPMYVPNRVIYYYRR